MFFRKKKDIKKIRRAEWDKYKMDINMRVMCLFEELSGKSYMGIETDEDMFMAIYSSLICSNKSISSMSYSAFRLIVLDDMDLLQLLIKKYERLGKYAAQFNKGDKEDDGEREEIRMMDIASTLILKYGMDPYYVMYEMEIWEIGHYYKSIEDKTKEELEGKRFWTYLNIMPHIDGKKIKGPQQLLKYPWEEEQCNKDFEMEAQAALGFLGGSVLEEKEEEDGKQ